MSIWACSFSMLDCFLNCKMSEMENKESWVSLCSLLPPRWCSLSLEGCCYRHRLSISKNGGLVEAKIWEMHGWLQMHSLKGGLFSEDSTLPNIILILKLDTALESIKSLAWHFRGMSKIFLFCKQEVTLSGEDIFPLSIAACRLFT